LPDLKKKRSRKPTALPPKKKLEEKKRRLGQYQAGAPVAPKAPTPEAPDEPPVAGANWEAPHASPSKKNFVDLQMQSPVQRTEVLQGPPGAMEIGDSRPSSSAPGGSPKSQRGERGNSGEFGHLGLPGGGGPWAILACRGCRLGEIGRSTHRGAPGERRAARTSQAAHPLAHRVLRPGPAYF
jgi:hypothetical protein